MIMINDRNTISATWLAACEYLMAQPKHEDTTVVLVVKTPDQVTKADYNVGEQLDYFLKAHGAFGNHTVAETIFPGNLYKLQGEKGVYEVYPTMIHEQLKGHPDLQWGTYAQRLLQRKDKNGKLFNPLKTCIEKMRNKRAMRAAYELDFDYGFDLATYDAVLDRNRRMGGPCLSHLSFKIMDTQRVHITALYRSHYYVQRLYGNLIGLARLQQFVADQTELKVGSLVCHSTMARLEIGGKEAPWKTKEVETLLMSCRSMYPSLSGASQFAV